MSKTKYVVYYRNLQFYLDYAMRLSNVDRMIGINQTRLMEPYISMNSRMRVAAMNEIEKDFHKLMKVAVYGKTWENHRKRTEIHLLNERVKAAKVKDKPHLGDTRIFIEKLVEIEMQQVKLPLTKPSYVGFVVMELRKLHMLKYPIPKYHPIIPITLSYFALHIQGHPSKDIIIALNRFIYDVIKARSEEKAHLLFTDA